MAVLGIRRGADRSAVRRAYTALLREFNPEHFPEQFRRIREAYETVLQQVDWNEAMQVWPPGDLQEEAPRDLDPAEEDVSSEQPVNAPTASLDKPIATNQVSKPGCVDGSLARRSRCSVESRRR